MDIENNYRTGSGRRIKQHIPYNAEEEPPKWRWSKKAKIKNNTKKIESIRKKLKKKVKKMVKKYIPKKVKNDVWDKYIGLEYGTAPCIVCRNSKINSKDFEAGHIISEYNGGLINTDNILPICSLCNKSMGTTNMDKYVEKYYPKNMSLFNKRIYHENNNNNLNQNSNQNSNLFSLNNNNENSNVIAVDIFGIKITIPSSVIFRT